MKMNRLRGIQIFNVPMGEERYVAAVLREKARKVENTTRRYVEDLEEQYPHEFVDYVAVFAAK